MHYLIEINSRKEAQKTQKLYIRQTYLLMLTFGDSKSIKNPCLNSTVLMIKRRHFFISKPFLRLLRLFAAKGFFSVIFTHYAPF